MTIDPDAHDVLLNVPGSALPQRLTPEREAEIRSYKLGRAEADLLRELDAVRAERDDVCKAFDTAKSAIQRIELHAVAVQRERDDWKRRALEAEEELRGCQSMVREREGLIP